MNDEEVIRQFTNVSFDKNVESLYFNRLEMKKTIDSNKTYTLQGSFIHRLLDCFHIYDKFIELNKNNIIQYLTERNESENVLEKIFNVDILDIINKMILLNSSIEKDLQLITCIQKHNDNKDKLLKILRLLQKITNKPHLFNSSPSIVYSHITVKKRPLPLKKSAGVKIKRLVNKNINPAAAAAAAAAAVAADSVEKVIPKKKRSVKKHHKTAEENDDGKMELEVKKKRQYSETDTQEEEEEEKEITNVNKKGKGEEGSSSSLPI